MSVVRTYTGYSSGRDTYRLQTHARRIVLCFAHNFFIPVCINKLGRYRSRPLRLRLGLQAEEGVSGGLLPHFLVEATFAGLEVCVILYISQSDNAARNALPCSSGLRTIFVCALLKPQLDCEVRAGFQRCLLSGGVRWWGFGASAVLLGANGRCRLSLSRGVIVGGLLEATRLVP